MFPTISKSQRLKLVTDACFLPDFDNPGYRVGESGDAIREVMIKAYDFWRSRINVLCENNRKNTEEHPGNCFMGPVIFPYLSAYLPNLVQNSSIDAWALKAHHIDWKASEDQGALSEWRKRMKCISMGLTAVLLSLKS